ncbi:hypothetical protein ACW0JT_14520 [Arthrobacter sp. SA17]
MKRLEEHGFVRHNWQHDQVLDASNSHSLNMAARSWPARRQLGAG